MTDKPEERLVQWYPAWDRCDSNPAKDYGIHGMEAALAASQARVEELENLLVNWLVAIGRSGEHWPSIEKETIDALQVSGHVRSDIDTGGEDG